MYDKNEEKTRLKQWLDKLNFNFSGYIYGDNKSIKTKTADFVNKDHNIAIELKREKNEKLDNSKCNNTSLSNRIEKYISDANKKFNKYPEYKTLLIIELKTSMLGIPSVMNGIPQLHFKNGQYTGDSIKNKRLFSKMENVGAIIFWPAPGNMWDKAYYYDNEFAKEICKIDLGYAKRILGDNLEVLENFSD